MFNIRRNPKVRFTFPRVKLDLGISMFFYNPNLGKDFVTNQLGAYIWLLMEDEISYDKIYEGILKLGLSIDQNELQKDISKICDIFVKQDLAEYISNYGG